MHEVFHVCLINWMLIKLRDKIAFTQAGRQALRINLWNFGQMFKQSLQTANLEVVTGLAFLT